MARGKRQPVRTSASHMPVVDTKHIEEQEAKLEALRARQEELYRRKLEAERSLQTPFERQWGWLYKPLQNVFGRIGLRFWLKFGIWALLFFVFVRLEFGIVYCIVSAIYLIFANTRTRKAGEMSAYSVFNDGYESLLGDLRMDQVEAELRGDRMLRGYQQQQNR